MKTLHIDTGPNHTSSRVGDSGYMSFQGLPCTALNQQQNLLDLSSQIAETEIGEQSDIVQSDFEGPNEVVSKNRYNSKTSYEPTSPIYDKNITLYDPNLFAKDDIYGSSLSNIKLHETHLKSNVIDDSVASVVSSVWGDELQAESVTSENWEVPSVQLLEQLSNAGKKGSHRSEIQLRY